MSLFLGNIHYWLYNKIIWLEEQEEAIVLSMQKQQNTANDLIEHIYSQFGPPTGGQALEEVIDTSNIHGWLQAKIESAELRQAALVTEFLKWNKGNREELIRICYETGKLAAEESEYKTNTPEEIFNAVNDFILEGMPCDRVNKMVNNTPDEFTWETTTCLHKGHWDRVGGDVQNFYEMRETWIRAFVENINPEFGFVKTGDGLNRIFRK